MFQESLRMPEEIKFNHENRLTADEFEVCLRDGLVAH